MSNIHPLTVYSVAGRGRALLVCAQPTAAVPVGTFLPLDGSPVFTQSLTSDDVATATTATVTIGNGAMTTLPPAPAAPPPPQHPYNLDKRIVLRAGGRPYMALHVKAADVGVVTGLLQRPADEPVECPWPFEHHPKSLDLHQGVDVSPATPLADALKVALDPSERGVVIVPLVAKAYSPADPSVRVAAVVGVMIL